MDKEIIEKECLRILSKDGSINFNDLDPIAKATWLSFEKGFLECFELLNKPIIEKHLVCKSCNTIGISDSDCICTYSNGYATHELEFDYPI
jgi:hypothetical protein